MAEANPTSTSGLLEWEFSLPSDQIISHGWYHGSISRPAAENVLQEDRQFLVRESISQPCNYVLSCKTNSQHLHFVIQRIVVHPETVYERYQYQFEDEAYDTVADLITSYVGSGKPISAASGAIIQHPANRTKPLSKFVSGEEVAAKVTSPSGSTQNSVLAAGSGPQVHDPSNKQRSHSLTPTDKNNDSKQSSSTSADGVIQDQAHEKSVKHFSGDSTSSSSTWDSNTPSSPPAKPARHDVLKQEENYGSRLELQLHYLVSGSDSGNGSGDSTQSSAQADQSRNREEACNSLATPTTKQEFDYNAAEEILLKSLFNDMTIQSRIKVDGFQSKIILPGLTMPLASQTLHTLKNLLHLSGPRVLANHLTQVDINFLLEDVIQVEGNDAMSSVYELCFLPQGRLLRRDIIERVETMRLIVAVTVLTSKTNKQKAETINDWIVLVNEAKAALGNLYGFTAIMCGLLSPQVTILEKAWNILRRKYTNNAFMFESKMKPCFKKMMEGTSPMPPNATTPNILPSVIMLYQCDGVKGAPLTPATYAESLINTMNFDFDACAKHLETSRRLPQQVAMFRRNAKGALREMSNIGPCMDPAVLEIFQTEFQINFLWGQNGAKGCLWQRFGTLFEILNRMAQKFAGETDEDSGGE